MPEINNKKPINDNGSRPIKNHSHFKPSYRLAATMRYGEYTPHFVMDVVPDDEHTFRCSHDVRSYTLKAPLLQGINMKKDYFLVPLSALLPLNHDKFITTPNVGEDINAQLVGTSVPNFFVRFSSIFGQALTLLSDDTRFQSSRDWFNCAFHAFIAFDEIYGSGSLLNYLGCHTSSNPDIVDRLIDAFWSKISDYIVGNDLVFSCRQSGDQSFYFGAPSNSYDTIVSLREAISRMRDGSFTIDNVSGTVPDTTELAGDYSSLYQDNLGSLVLTGIINSSTDSVDLARVFSYQIVCAHFFSNDHVDYIYSAELYRQNLRSLISNIDETIVSSTFNWNGVSYLYDTLSGFCFSNVLDHFDGFFGDSLEGLVDDYTFDYLRLVFGFNRSLRFGDYFTSARTHPLTQLGDSNSGVAVNDGMVDVVETIQKRWYIKMWSQISRVGRKLSEQMKGLFPGVASSTDWHEPIWLAHTADLVHPEETENTGDAQMSKANSITSTLNGNASKFGFHINVNDRYGIIIGITYFDVSRFYALSVERPFFHIDRYDKFNPFLQWMGDQKVYSGELLSGNGSSTAFGYQGRYMEYKQRYDQAVGGFIDGSLPTYLFLADTQRNLDNIRISPSYIRSYPSELDKFYVSLTGYSLGSYFHFMVISSNMVDSNRPMSYNPQID